MPTDRPGVAQLNAAGASELRSTLTTVCTSPAWVAAMVDGRPYADTATLYEVSDRSVAALDDQELAAALGGHPRIGERPTGAHAAQSRSEQSGMDDASVTTAELIRSGNVAYEGRFGHVYLVCATGLGPDRLLSILKQRLGNSAEKERRVVLDELAKINRLRLERLVDSPAPTGRANGVAS